MERIDLKDWLNGRIRVLEREKKKLEENDLKGANPKPDVAWINYAFVAGSITSFVSVLHNLEDEDLKTAHLG